MSKKMEINLLNFFVFNSTFGPREGEEHQRILFYHPSAIDIDTKIKQVGLCEAIIKFSQTFTDEPCSNVHTQKTRQLFLQVEPEYWMIMTVCVPYSQRSKDGQSFIEYHEDDVQDSVYDAVLHQAYDMFKFFNGSMEKIVADSGIEELLRRLEHFFSKYLLTLKLSQSNIMDIVNGIHFLPLDKNTYLRIQCFINLLEAQFPRVKYTAFLFNDQLVWSGLEQEDMRVLYAYLTTGLFPSYNESELQGAQSKSGPVASTHYGKFILGPPNLKDESNVGKIPRIYLIKGSTQSEECLLAVYRALNASVCLIMDGNTSLSFDYLRKLDRFLGPQLSSLASDIGDQYGKRPNISSAEAQIKFVYFNQMNLAQKTTVHSDGRKTSNAIIPADILRILADMNHDLNSVTAVEDGETIVKTCSDCWVVGKKSDQREFYVVLTHRNANLIEINEEVKKLCAANFSNIFFLD